MVMDYKCKLNTKKYVYKIILFIFIMKNVNIFHKTYGAKS